MTFIVSKPEYGAVLVDPETGLATDIFQNFMDDIEQIINENGSNVVTVATLPIATKPGQRIYVTDESGGEVGAISDTSLNFRRSTDTAIVS